MSDNRALQPAHEELPALRAARGWSKAELADLADVQRSTVTRWENATRGLEINVQSLTTLRKFEAAFGLPPGYFLEEQLLLELQELTRLVKAGHVRLPQLHAVVTMGQAEERDAGRDGQ